jgi:hypothetical protein
MPPASSVPALSSAPRQPNSCALSIIVASIDSSRTIDRALAALERSTAGVDAEIIVVDASTDNTAARVRASRPEQRIREFKRGTLVPHLWAAGFATSCGQVVAFTVGQCVVSESWASAVLSGIDRGAVGVSGSLALSPDSGVVDWALFYLRYSAFLGCGVNEVEPAREIPGDNAAYRRDALERHATSFADGFWEVDFHRRLRAEDPDTQLAFVRGASVDLGPSTSLASLVRQRFAHGCHSGAWRVQTGVRAAWQVIAAAPVVPFILITRMSRRVFSRPEHRWRFVAALPALLVLAASWAAGEAWGALADGHLATVRDPRFAA